METAKKIGGRAWQSENFLYLAAERTKKQRRKPKRCELLKKNMANNKPRVIKNFEKIDDQLRELIAAAYPNGYTAEIKTFDIGGGKFMTALPLETEQFSYLIKFPVKEDIDIDDGDIDMGADDDMNLEGGEDVDEEEDEEIEKPMGDLTDLEVADEGE